MSEITQAVFLALLWRMPRRGHLRYDVIPMRVQRHVTSACAYIYIYMRLSHGMYSALVNHTASYIGSSDFGYKVNIFTIYSLFDGCV